MKIVLCLLLGNSPASEFYMSTFRNTLSVPSSYLPAYEDGTVFRSVGIKNTDAGELPRRKHTTFRTRRKFEIKNMTIILILHQFYEFQKDFATTIHHVWFQKRKNRTLLSDPRTFQKLTIGPN